jgi:phytoene dehydrogenase-like protein
MEHYDTIVIGSGSGGMTAAVALARAGQKVLVCEQHEIPGGWTHSFTLEGYKFSTGVHYIGEIGRGGFLRAIYEGLGLSNDLEFLELNPDGFDHVFIGEESFDIPKHKRKYIRRLKDRFPHEAEGIDRYFKLVLDISYGLMNINSFKRLLKYWRTLPWLFRSGGRMINDHVKDPVLRAILGAQTGDNGLAPSKVSAPMHAGIMAHYFRGAYYPRGGGGAIPKAYMRALQRAGGELRLKTPVKKILIEDGRAVGVELPGGEKVSADNIVSNADPHTTFIKLIGEEKLPGRLRRKVRRVKYSTSCLSLFLAVDLDLEALGFDSGNYWLYDHADLEKIYQDGMGDANVYQDPSALFVTVTTLKDPSKMIRGHHTLEVFAFTGYEPFAKWANEPSGDRSWEYLQLKEQITGRMINTLEKRIPGIKDAVVFKDLGTPLTNAHYLNAHQGNIYGIEKGIWQVGPLAFKIKSGIENLYLCGQSTTSHGIGGTASSGLSAAGTILGVRGTELLSKDETPLRVYPCDDISKWPEHLQQRIQQGRIKKS